MQLKKYQKDSLLALGQFLDDYETDGLLSAFLDNNQLGSPYTPPQWQDSSLKKKIPYVGLKAPTGSGKTTIASAWMGAVAKHPAFASKMGVILVPSKNIANKTLREYKDTSSLIHTTLQKSVNLPIKVVSSEEALRLSSQYFQNNFVVVIATYATFRKEEKDSLRFYRDNSAYLDFFGQLSTNQLKALLVDEDISSDRNQASGRILHSLVNMIRMHNPIVIVDESHQNSTRLSQETVEILAPSFVLETSATPRENSNVLHIIDAADVEAEDMISLPHEIYPSLDWRNAIRDGVDKRNELEKAWRQEGGKNSRITLLQAERADHQATTLDKGYVSVYDTIEELLVLGVKREEIAVLTGSLDEVSSIDFKTNTKVKFVVTVQAGAEGWDCPAACILVALGASSSNIRVEQLIGRVLRREGGVRYSSDALNKSYTYCGTPSFHETATSIKQGIEANGYSGSSVIVPGNSPTPTAQKSLVLLKKGFSDVKQPSFFQKKGKGKIAIKDPGEWVAIAAKKGKEIDTSALEKAINKNKADKAIALDLDKTSGKLSAKDLSNTQSLNNVTGKGDRKEIINRLSQNIRVNYVSHAQVKKTVENTLKKTYKSWSPEDLWRHLPDIETSIENKIILRLKKLCMETLKDGVKDGSIVAEMTSLAKSLEQVSVDTNGIPLDNHVYEKAAAMNGLEKDVAAIITKNPENKWLRNPERIPGAVSLPGLGRMHYPDFLVDHDGKIIIIESKGEHLLGSGDSNEKQFLGKQLELASGGKIRYLMVGEKNDGVGGCEASLDELKKILG